MWRELRRLRQPLANPSLEQLRLAADQAEWDQFIKLMKQHKVTLQHQQIKDAAGAIKQNQYKEAIERVFGLSIEGLSGLEVLRTRFKEWFLVDLDKLEQRMIRGLPLHARDRPDYLESIKTLLKQAVDQKKVGKIYAELGGVVPFSPCAALETGTVSAAPLGLVGNNVTEKQVVKK